MNPKYDKNYYKNILSKLKKSKKISIKELKNTVYKVIEVISKENNIAIIKSPCIIFGNCNSIHNFLKKFVFKFDFNSEYKIIFLGNFINFSENSIDILLLLYLHKIIYPDKIYIVRGFNESKHISHYCGLKKEIMSKYNCFYIFDYIILSFNYLIIGALLDNKIFMVSSFLSKELLTINEYLYLDRYTDSFFDNNLYQLSFNMFEDTSINKKEVNDNRLNCKIINEEFVLDFIEHNNIQLIICTNKIINNGYEYMLNNMLLFIWSNPNYGTFINNKGYYIDISNINEIKLIEIKL